MGREWIVLLLHTQRETLLKRAVEASFPGRVVSLHVPSLALGRRKALFTAPSELVSHFNRYVYDKGLWNNRVLTVYGDGELHHYTYALSKFSADKRGLTETQWTYAHFDQHRDCYNRYDPDNPWLDCGSFVDAIAYDHNATPFLIGPDIYPSQDVRGFRIKGREIPLYSNFFTKRIQSSRSWRGVRSLSSGFYGTELPSRSDLRETPSPAYLSFDLDVLSTSEIVTNFDQSEHMTLRRLCQIVDRVREYKQVFGADILGFPDSCHHSLSALTVVILARKIMGLGIERLLEYHAQVKRLQTPLLARLAIDKDDRNRPSPISEGQLLEMVS